MERRNFAARRPMVAVALFAGIVLGHSAPGLAATSTPYSGTPVSIPGTVQAESFDSGAEGVAYHDTTKGNAGGKYRTTDVDIQSNSTGGYNLGWIDVAEWLNYTVKVATAGNYTVQLRVASLSGASLHLKFNSASNVSKGVAIPATGDWQNWTTVSVPVTLGAGTQQMTLLADTAGFNIDYVTIVSGGSGSGSSSGPVSTPYTTAVSLPGTVQVENFDNGGEGVAYHDTTAGNAGTQYRATDVDIEAASAGGYDIGWIVTGEWLKYTVSVSAAGSYTVQLRVASPSGASMHVGFNAPSNASVSVSIPATGDWHNWTTVSVPVTLGAGTQVMTLTADASAFNIDYLNVVSGGAPAVTVTSKLTSPASGASYTAPATISLGATASTSSGSISKVEFFNGSTLIGTSTAAPYAATWSNVAAGTYTVSAKATNSTGVTATSPSVTVTVASPAPPPPVTVTSKLTSPASGASYTAPATISLAATASTSSGSISKVEFFSGSTLIGTSMAAPYAATWSNVAAGTYTVSAKATNSTGVTATSPAVTVTVASPAPPPPPVTVTSTLTSPADGSSFLAPITITLAADASTTSGTLTKVEFFDGSTLIGSVTTAPYTGKWNSVPAGSYTISAKATSSSGVTATSAPSHVTVAASTPNPNPLPQGALVQSSNLVYQGAFRVPGILVPGKDRGFDYGGTAPAFNPAHNSLFLVSHMYDQMTAEISIPALGTGSAASLPQASALHGFMDATDGKLHNIAPDPSTTDYIGGQYVSGNQLIVSAYTYYGGGPTASHFSRSTNLNTAGAVGPVSVGSMGTSFYSGYMGAIPAAWQATLGGPALTGDCCLSVISRTSYGPAAFAFDPANLTGGSTPLVYYDSTHPTLGDWGVPGANPYFNGTTQITGIVFPEGTSSVLFFGTHGLGSFCYGEAATCGDPEGTAKGDHAYPYAYYVWAYDAHDLAAVRAGTKQPWAIKPYAVWEIKLPTPPNHNGKHLGGAAYDPATGRLFLSQQFGEGDYPLIHVFTIK